MKLVLSLARQPKLTHAANLLQHLSSSVRWGILQVVTQQIPDGLCRLSFESSRDLAARVVRRDNCIRRPLVANPPNPYRLPVNKYVGFGGLIVLQYKMSLQSLCKPDLEGNLSVCHRFQVFHCDSVLSWITVRSPPLMIL